MFSRPASHFIVVDFTCKSNRDLWLRPKMWDHRYFRKDCLIFHYINPQCRWSCSCNNFSSKLLSFQPFFVVTLASISFLWVNENISKWNLAWILGSSYRKIRKIKPCRNSICEYHRKEEKKTSIIRIHLTIKTHQRTHKIFWIASIKSIKEASLSGFCHSRMWSKLLCTILINRFLCFFY